MSSKIRIAVCYRVMQSWRVPIFSRLAALPDVELKLFYGDDFDGTKVKSYRGDVNFSALKLKSKNFKIRTMHGYAYFPVSFSLFHELKSYDPDVVLVEGASNFFNNIIAFLYCKIYKRRIVQWGLGEIRGRKKSLHRKLLDVIFGFVERNSDAAIVYSTFGANYYRKIGYSEHDVYVAVNVVDTDAERCKRLRVLESVERLDKPFSLNLLYVGAIAENKGVDMLLNAVSRVSKMGLSVGVSIVGGGGALAEMKHLAMSLGMNNVKFHGELFEGLENIYDMADVFVMPGLGGLAISQALCHDLPVICGVGDGCESDLINSENGFFIPDLNENILVEKIVYLYENRNVLDKMKRNAYSPIASGLDVNSYVSQICRAARGGA